MFYPANEEDEKSSMTLSNEEVGWTEAVKEAALQDNSLKTLTDFEYAHHALFQQGNAEGSLFQIEGMQHFREEYEIEDTVEQGMELIQKFHEQQPWFLLDIGYEQKDFVMVWDYAQLNPALKLPEDWRTFLGGMYYIYQIVNCNLRSIREGVVFVGEVDGMGWNNFSIELIRTFWHHFMEFLPHKMKEVSWIHDSVIGNIFESLHRTIMGDRAKNICIGIKNEAYDGRLDGMFKLPTPEIAFDRLLKKCRFLLTCRFRNYQSFQLPLITTPELTEEDILASEAIEGGEESSDEEDEEVSDDEDAAGDEPEEPVETIAVPVQF